MGVVAWKPNFASKQGRRAKSHVDECRAFDLLIRRFKATSPRDQTGVSGIYQVNALAARHLREDVGTVRQPAFLMN